MVVRGLDLTGDYVLDFDNGGTLTLTTAINFNNRKVTRVAETLPELAAITGLPLYNRNNLISYSRGQPRAGPSTSPAATRSATGRSSPR